MRYIITLIFTILLIPNIVFANIAPIDNNYFDNEIKSVSAGEILFTKENTEGNITEYSYSINGNHIIPFRVYKQVNNDNNTVKNVSVISARNKEFADVFKYSVVNILYIMNKDMSKNECENIYKQIINNIGISQHNKFTINNVDYETYCDNSVVGIVINFPCREYTPIGTSNI